MLTDASTTTCTRPSLSEETRVWIPVAIQVVPAPFAAQKMGFTENNDDCFQATTWHTA